jgi:hypothetical protein
MDPRDRNSRRLLHVFSMLWPRTIEVKLLIIVLVLMAAVQAVYFVRVQALYPTYGLTTEEYYSPPAKNILHHGVYGFGEAPNIQETTFRPPLYSIVLAGAYWLLWEDEIIALILNNLACLGTIIVAYLIGCVFDRKIGLLAAFIYALEPARLVASNTVEAGALYGFFFALFFLVTLRLFSSDPTITRSVASSALLGISTFVRTASLYLWLPLLIALVFVQRILNPRVRLSQILVIVLLFTVVQGAIIGGWMYRNHAVSGNLDFASMTTVHLRNFFIPAIIARDEGISIPAAKTRYIRSFELDAEYLDLDAGSREMYVVRQSARRILKSPITAIRIIVGHVPVLYLDYPMNTAVIFLGDDRRADVETEMAEYVRGKTSRLDVTGYKDVIVSFSRAGLVPLLFHAAFFKSYLLLMMPGILVGLWLLLSNRDRRSLGIMFLVVVGYMTLISSIWPAARFRLPISPIYSVLVSYSLIWGWAYMRMIFVRKNDRSSSGRPL